MTRKDVATALARLHSAAGFGDYVKTLESGYQDAVASALVRGLPYETREDHLADARVYKDLIDTIKRDSPK